MMGMQQAMQYTNQGGDAYTVQFTEAEGGPFHTGALVVLVEVTVYV